MPNTELSIVMYHYVRDLTASAYPEIKGLELHDFEKQLDFFHNEGFAFVSTEELVSALNNEKPLAEKAVLLTFDDGYIDHYGSVFPLLKKKGISAFFSMPGKIVAEGKLLDVNKIHFILASKSLDDLLPLVFDRLNHYRAQGYDIAPNEDLYSKLAQATRFDQAETIFIKRLLQVELAESLRALIVDDLFELCVGKSEADFARELYMSLDQVREMHAAGMCFGIHGYDHYWMNRLSPKELELDITRALEVFDGIVDEKSWLCCYPYGSVSDEVVDYIKAHGAVAGFTTVVGRADIAQESPYKLSRFDTNDFPPKSMNYLSY